MLFLISLHFLFELQLPTSALLPSLFEMFFLEKLIWFSWAWSFGAPAIFKFSLHLFLDLSFSKLLLRFSEIDELSRLCFCCCWWPSEALLFRTVESCIYKLASYFGQLPNYQGGEKKFENFSKMAFCATFWFRLMKVTECFNFHQWAWLSF